MSLQTEVTKGTEWPRPTADQRRAAYANGVKLSSQLGAGPRLAKPLEKAPAPEILEPFKGCRVLPDLTNPPRWV